jgi:hypothetical protein
MRDEEKDAMTRVLSPFAVLIAGLLAASTAAAQDAPVAAPPSASGTCIAMSLPSVQGADGSATDLAAAVRNLFTSFLQGPAVTVVPLDARLTLQANEEARQKSCAHVLVVSLTRKRGGGRVLGRALGQAAGTAAWFTPVASVGAAVARSAALAGAQAAADIAANTRAKDEMRLEYRLLTTEGRVVVKPKEEKAKASADGEDLLTPLVQTASEAIAAVVITKERPKE